MSGDRTVAPPILSGSIIAGLSDGKIVPSDAGATIPGVNESKRAQFIMEVCEAVVQGKLHWDKFDTALRAAGVSEGQEETIANCFWLLSNTVVPSANGLKDAAPAAAFPEALLELVRVALQKKWVTKQSLLESQEPDFLTAAGVTHRLSNADFMVRERRHMTNQLFKQSKYNLFREDNEGYAKLVTLLGSAPLSPATLGSVVAEITALIGTFELDPNRVADVVLVAWQLQPLNTTFLQLMPLFNTECPAQMLGFQLLNHSRAEDTSSQQDSGFYTVAAQVIKAGLVTIEQLLPYMGPQVMEEAAAAHQAAVESALIDAGVKGRAAAATQEVAAADTAGQGSKRARDQIKFSMSGPPAAAPPSGEAPQAGTFGPLDLGVIQYLRPWLDPGHPLLGLLRGMLEIGDWEHAQLMFDWLQLRGIEPAHDASICQMLIQQLADVVGPLAAPLIPLTSLKGVPSRQRQDYATIPEEVFRLCGLLGVYISRSPSLFMQLLRVLRFHVEEFCVLPSSRDGGEAFDEAKISKVEQLLGRGLLPGLCLLPGCYPLAEELWYLLRPLPHQRRFLLYLDTWELQLEQPLCALACHKAVEEVKRINRRSVQGAKDRQSKQLGRAHARRYQRIATGVPIAALNEVISWATTAFNQVEATNESIRYFSDMALDIVTCLVLHHLGSLRRGKLKGDGLNLQTWLTNAADFLGTLYKRIPEAVDAYAVGCYLAAQLRKAEGWDVVVLQKLLETACGISVVTAAQGSQATFLGYSQMVCSVRTKQGFDPSVTTSVENVQQLVSALQTKARGPGLAVPLFVLLAQQLQFALYTTRTESLSLVMDLHGRTHATLLEFMELLHMGLDLQQLAQLLPSLPELVEGCGVPVEFAFGLWRPLLHALLPTYGNAGAGGLEDGEEGELQDGTSGMDTESMLELASYPEVAGVTLPQVLAGLGGLRAFQRYGEVLLRPELFLAFWGLELQDLVYDPAIYQSSIAEVQKQIGGWKNKMATIPGFQREIQRSTELLARGYNVAQQREQLEGAKVKLKSAEDDLPMWEAEVVHCKDQIHHLQQDMQRHEARHKASRARLLAEKDVFITTAETRAGGPPLYGKCCNMVLAMVLPRALTSLMDAMFCHQFAMMLYKLNTPGWSCITYWDKLVKELVNRIPACTSHEAVCLALLLEQTMAMLEAWRTNKAEFEKAVRENSTLVVKELGRPGAPRAAPAAAPAPAAGTGAAAAAAGAAPATTNPTSTTNPATATTTTSSTVQDGSHPVDHSFLCNLCAKFQNSLTATFLNALGSGDATQQRSAMTIMSKLSQVFPLIQENWETLSRALDTLWEEGGQELKTMVASLKNIFKQRQDIGLQSNREYRFLRPAPPRKQPPPAAAPGDERPAKKLRPDAPEFKPRPGQDKEGTPAAESGQAEDGSGRAAIKAPAAGGGGGGAKGGAGSKAGGSSRQAPEQRGGAAGEQRGGSSSQAAAKQGQPGGRGPAGQPARRDDEAEGRPSGKRARQECGASESEPGEVPASPGGTAPGGASRLAGNLLAAAGVGPRRQQERSEGGPPFRHQQQQQQREPKEQQRGGQQQPKEQQQQKREQPKEHAREQQKGGQQQQRGGQQGAGGAAAAAAGGGGGGEGSHKRQEGAGDQQQKSQRHGKESGEQQQKPQQKSKEGREQPQKDKDGREQQKDSREKERDSSRGRPSRKERGEGEGSRDASGEGGGDGGKEPPSVQTGQTGQTQGRRQRQPIQPPTAAAPGGAGGGGADADEGDRHRRGSGKEVDRAATSRHELSAAKPVKDSRQGAEGDRGKEGKHSRDKGPREDKEHQQGGSSGDRGGRGGARQPAEAAAPAREEVHDKEQRREEEQQRERRRSKERPDQQQQQQREGERRGRSPIAAAAAAGGSPKDKEKERGRDREKERGKEAGSPGNAAKEPRSSSRHHAHKEHRSRHRAKEGDEGKEVKEGKEGREGKEGKGSKQREKASPHSSERHEEHLQQQQSDGGKPPRHPGGGGGGGGGDGAGGVEGRGEAGRKRPRDRSSDRMPQHAQHEREAAQQQQQQGRAGSPAKAAGRSSSQREQVAGKAEAAGGAKPSRAKGQDKGGAGGALDHPAGSGQQQREQQPQESTAAKSSKEARQGDRQQQQQAPDSKRDERADGKEQREETQRHGSHADAPPDTKRRKTEESQQQQPQQQGEGGGAAPKRRHAPIMFPGSASQQQGGAKQAPKRTSR